MRFRILAAATVAVAALAVLAAPAQSATTEPVYSGTGWKALTSHGIYSIAPDPYTIVFANVEARAVLKPYFTNTATKITAITGVPVVVTDIIDTTPVGSCPSRHRIIAHYEHQPLGQPGYSQARPCYSIADGSAWGGHVRMDSEYWTVPDWFGPDPALNEALRKSAVSHETGHIFGLDHPNYDRDKDGTIEAYECVTNSKGWRPLMCSPNGGDRSSSGTGAYVTEFDAKGLTQMADNYYLRQN